MTLTLKSIHDRALEGMKLLDAFHDSPDWVMTIDLNNLDLSSPTHCVVGQQFDTYDEGIDRLELDCDADLATVISDTAHGFECSAGSVLFNKMEYAALTEAWRYLIEERLRNLWDQNVEGARDRIDEVRVHFNAERSALASIK